MRIPLLLRAAVFLAATSVLASCALLPDEPTPSPTGSPLPQTPPSTSEPEESPLLDADILLLVTATATADSGAAMNVTLRVHSSTAWNSEDPTAVIRPEFMTSACSGYLDASVYEAQAWSFALIDYSATFADGTDAWTPDAKLGVRPTSEFLSVAAGGVLIDDPAAAKDSPHCKRDKILAGSGDGTLVTGFMNDAALTKWAGHVYGFQAIEGVTLSDCSYLLTGPGELAGGVESAWTEIASDSECSIGPATEQQDS